MLGLTLLNTTVVFTCAASWWWSHCYALPYLGHGGTALYIRCTTCPLLLGHHFPVTLYRSVSYCYCRKSDIRNYHAENSDRKGVRYPPFITQVFTQFLLLVLREPICLFPTIYYFDPAQYAIYGGLLLQLGMKVFQSRSKLDSQGSNTLLFLAIVSPFFGKGKICKKVIKLH